MRLHHVTVPIAPGGEDRARAFYGDLLGLEETAVLPRLDPSALIWFRTGGGLELHLLITSAPASEGHRFCLVVDEDLAPLRARLEGAGVPTLDQTEIIGRPRFVARDPFGNRVELTSFDPTA